MRTETNGRLTRPSRIGFGASGAQGSRRLEFELDARTLELSHQGRPLELRPQAVQLLAILLRNEGRLVPIEELRGELWGEQHLEWRDSLYQCVRDLRRALSDDARSPRFVANVPRLGYRFVGMSAPIVPSVPGPNRRHSIAFAAGFAAAVLLPVSFFILCVALG